MPEGKISKMPEHIESYTIEASFNGFRWKHIAAFNKGCKSHWGPSFDINIAILEVESFKNSSRGKDFNFIRLIVDIK